MSDAEVGAVRLTAGPVRDVIRSVLCRGLTVEQADEIARVLLPVRAAVGESIVREGDPPSGLFILLTGTVEITKHASDRTSQSLARLDAPTVLGEVGLLTGQPRSATVRAVTACELSLLTHAQFQRLIANESIAAYKLVATIAAVLAGRLVRLNEKVIAFSPTHRVALPEQEVERLKEKLLGEWRL